MYLVEVLKEDRSVALHIFPDRVWEPTSNGKFCSRPLNGKEDAARRAALALSLTKGGVEVLARE